MIPLERTNQDLGRSTILIMKIQKGGPEIKIIWGKLFLQYFKIKMASVLVGRRV